MSDLKFPAKVGEYQIATLDTVGRKRYQNKKDAAYWKAKYDKCITVIKKFDAGIISMYDL